MGLPLKPLIINSFYKKIANVQMNAGDFLTEFFNVPIADTDASTT